MGKTVLGIILLLLLSSVTGGCSRTLVTLVPDPEGRVGSVSVRNDAGSIAIATPYRATTMGVRKKAPSAPVDLGREGVEKIFAEALSIEPQRPLHFLVHFVRDLTLTQQGDAAVGEIVAAAWKKRSGYISVIGHCDTMGTREYNIAISRARAMEVRRLLVKGGVPPGSITTTWRGEEELIVPTPDAMWELRNRAVEVIVR